MDYKNYIGPRKRRAIRRRKMKAALLSILTVFIFSVSSWTVREVPKQRPKPALDASNLQFMINISNLSPGDADYYSEQHPEYKYLFLNGGTIMSNQSWWKEQEKTLGRLYTTRGVFEQMDQSPFFYDFVWKSLKRFVEHDWGEMAEEDKKLNDEAVKSGDQRVFAAYEDKDYDFKIWIITEADRLATTVLFPEEY